MSKTSTEQSGPYESAREGFSTESDTSVTEQTYYGSAPEEFWTELEPEDPSHVETVIGVSEDNTTGEVSVVMEAMQGDLRNLIDKRIDYLESANDLAYDGFAADVGDYESSEGIVGTGFWRAPEVLRALRNKITPTYSTAVDVYGFGMVCYELLTGRIPFEGHRLSDYELVLSGGRPELPDYVSPEITQLLHQCRHMDPCQRPGWSQIKSIIEREFHTKPNANFVHLSEHTTHQTNHRNRNSFRFKWKLRRLNTF
ncbi:unnamed protein product [Sphagnum jensenii]|uniref:Protein kinase domain-containing protein n=1 Tax=Sphagnum jensenii TaxID=128206 RepID=A0ABP1BS69_9BRYO